jgi:hypothetical protein
MFREPWPYADCTHRHPACHIHCACTRDTGWTHRPGALYASRMPDRIASSQAAHDAERQENPRIKQIFSEAAQRYLTLAAKLEVARRAKH